jgi:hypothetical protein
MTPDEFGEVDIDLLADYIGGALDAPAEAEVARLIDQDPRWREAHDLLIPGMAAVGAELTALGAAPETMPADLASRLEDSFASPIASPTTIDPVLAGPAEPHIEPSTSRHLSSVPGTRGVDRPARRRKRLRWAAPIAVAAGVLAFAGFGADYLAEQSVGSDDTASSTAGRAENAAPMIGTDSGSMTGLIGAPTDDQITSSGTDYDSAQLAESAAAGQTARDDRAESPLAAAGGKPVELQRLWVRAALLACLEAISQQNGQGPIKVQNVDYARYQGAPALVVRFIANGTSVVWAVGPDCGAAGGANRL